jgi:hypothetical protein
MVFGAPIMAFDAENHPLSNLPLEACPELVEGGGGLVHPLFHVKKVALLGVQFARFLTQIER